MIRLRRFWSRSGLLVICVLVCAGFFVLLTPGNPLLGLVRIPVTTTDARLIVGSYPLPSDLQRLARSGVRTIVSLLDPRIPYEAVLLARERRWCRRYNLQFFNFPMGSILGRRFGGCYDENAERAARAVISAPGKVYLHCYLGLHRIQAVQDRLKTAQQTTDRYVPPLRFRLAPDRLRERAQEGWSLYGLHRIPEARAVFARLLRDHPRDVEGLRGLAYCDLRESRLAEAEAGFTAILRRVPEDVMALEGLALVRYRQGRGPEAARYFRQVLKLQPDHPEALRFLGRLRDASDGT